jgi:hypothetical protein
MILVSRGFGCGNVDADAQRDAGQWQGLRRSPAEGERSADKPAVVAARYGPSVTHSMSSRLRGPPACRART